MNANFAARVSSNTHISSTEGERDAGSAPNDDDDEPPMRMRTETESPQEMLKTGSTPNDVPPMKMRTDTESPQEMVGTSTGGSPSSEPADSPSAFAPRNGTAAALQSKQATMEFGGEYDDLIALAESNDQTCNSLNDCAKEIVRQSIGG